MGCEGRDDRGDNGLAAEAGFDEEIETNGSRNDLRLAEDQLTQGVFAIFGGDIFYFHGTARDAAFI